MVQLKRVYDAPEPQDGLRVLVDRLWPRGVSKDRARLNLWLKEIAPSHALRKWFGHDPAKWEEFKKRYVEELKENQSVVDQLRVLAEEGTVTLLFGARDEQHNEAIVIRDYLENR